jgi:hypothetical protein
VIARYLTPALGIALALALLVLWSTGKERDVARAERDAALAAYGVFRAETKAEGLKAKVANAAETSRLEKLSNDTRTAYEISVDRLRSMLAAERVRRAVAEGGIRAGGDRVSSTADAASEPDDGSADAGSGAAGSAAAEEVAGTLTERCAMTTLQCAWLQHWAAGLKPPDARP